MCGAKEGLLMSRCWRVGLLAILLLGCWSIGMADVTGSCWDDSFDSGEIDPRWQWLRESPRMWELNPYRGGRLTIATEPGGLLYDTDNARNLLMTEAPEWGFEMITELAFVPRENFHFAGLVVYRDDGNFMAYGRAFCDHPEGCVGSGIYFDHEENGLPLPGNFATRAGGERHDFLRLIRVGPYYVAYHSLDGEEWQLIGIKQTATLSPRLVGIGAWGGDSSIQAEFDSVSLNPDTAPALDFVGQWESDAAVYRIEEWDGQFVMINETADEVYPIAFTGTLHAVWESDHGPVHFEGEVLFDDSGTPSAILYPNGVVIEKIKPLCFNMGPALVVNATDDHNDGCCDSSDCTLREAIAAANSQTGPNTITFNIPISDPGCIDIAYSSGECTLSEITLTSDLPPIIDDGTVIDARGADGCASTVIIDAANASYGLNVAASGTGIHGLTIENAKLYGVLIFGASATGNELTCNRIRSNAQGIAIAGGASSNTIGPGSLTQANIVIGNSTSGIYIGGGGSPASSGNVVRYNYIGVSASGASVSSNLDGVVIYDTSKNTVGPGNVISGNSRDGVRVVGGAAFQNTITGNHIGTNVFDALGLGNQRFGILLEDEAHENTITDNVVSGNGYKSDYPYFGGVGVKASPGNALYQNLIGTDSGGFDPLPNAAHGVILYGGSDGNRIGDGVLEAYANTIAFNEGDGVHVVGPYTIRDTIHRNSIHTNDDLGIRTLSGGNIELPPPLVTKYEHEPATGWVDLEAEACPGCKVLVFSDDDGEGRVYEGEGVADPWGGFNWDGVPTVKAFTLVNTDGNGNTSEFSATPAKLNLSIDDALPHTWVNKVVGDSGGPADETVVEFVAFIESWDPSLRDNVILTLTVPTGSFGNSLLGAPTRVFVRDQIASSDGATISYSDLGGGQYQVSGLALLPTGNSFQRRVVFRFEIPNTTTPQQINATATVEVVGRSIRDPEDTATLRIIAAGSVRSIIITNRHLLYQEYDDEEVTALLNRLFTMAQGSPASTAPLATIYYGDAYSTAARNWDNATVSYASDATANQVFQAIDELIEDWNDDATLYSVWSFMGVPFSYPYAYPAYLLIVGGDDVIPFYRLNDPIDEEVTWGVNSATEPAIWATDNDYFFTDAPYANTLGSDWLQGELELAVGRIVGADAADMETLVANGTQGLGTSPNATVVSDERNDVDSVVSSLSGAGLTIRNDGGMNDTTEDDTWTKGVMTAAMGLGFRFYAHCNHGSYDGYGVGSGPGFGAWEVAGVNSANAIFSNRPLVSTSGCHSGLVVDMNGTPQPADNLVWAFVHEGCSAYLGSGAFVYLDSRNGHIADGEEWFNDFYELVVKPTITLGEASRLASVQYNPGGAMERRSAVQFILYGLPWIGPAFPKTSTTIVTAVPDLSEALADGYDITLHGPEQSGESNRYTRTLVLSVEDYNVEADDGFEVVTIPGTELTFYHRKPVLPKLYAPSIFLPADAQVVEVSMIGGSDVALGRVNIPAAQASTTTAPAESYTSDADVSGMYPEVIYGYDVNTSPRHVEVLPFVFPVQHDPESMETVLWESVTLELTYETRGTVAVVQISTDRLSYASDEDIEVAATVCNADDSEALLHLILTVENEYGDVLTRDTRTEVSVLPGETSEVRMLWPSRLEPGSYRATLSVWARDEQVAAASAGFQVLPDM